MRGQMVMVMLLLAAAVIAATLIFMLRPDADCMEAIGRAVPESFRGDVTPVAECRS